MSSNQQLLICYPPGARGDFLAGILLGIICDFSNSYKVDIDCNLYLKRHSINLFNYNQNFTVRSIDEIIQNVSIRIKIEDLTDCQIIAHFWKTKKLPLLKELDSIIIFLKKYEKETSKYDRYFKHVIEFKRLFDINFLVEFYHTLKGETLSDNVIKKIQYNINLQDTIIENNENSTINSTIKKLITKLNE